MSNATLVNDLEAVAETNEMRTDSLRVRKLQLVNSAGETVLYANADGETPGVWFSNPKVPGQSAGVFLKDGQLVVTLHDARNSVPAFAAIVGKDQVPQLQMLGEDRTVQNFRLTDVAGLFGEMIVGDEDDDEEEDEAESDDDSDN